MTDNQQTEANECPVVGVGASAGGLEALLRMFEGMPEQVPVAFVVVQHLEPTHDSALSDILQRHTTLSVIEVVDEVPVQSRHVYINPPGKYLAFDGKCLKLCAPAEPRSSRMAIDHFFLSLAASASERAVGVVLSGTGTDGTAGLRAIRQNNGLTVVQAPDDAEYSGMPDSAIGSGTVDCVLPAAEIGGWIISYLENSHQRELPTDHDTVVHQAPVDSVLTLLKEQSGIDFRRYRHSTVRRCIHRRMTLGPFASMQDYLHELKTNLHECAMLKADILVGATQFFRDPEAWEELERHILQPLMKAGRPNRPIRIWCAGCATGEEAYSLSMLCHENAVAEDNQASFQIIATDVSNDALEVARAGQYPESIVTDVSGTRLQRFFRKNGNTWQVTPQLQASIVFAEQNVLSESSLSQVDLIVCRNLLIYLDKAAQQDVLDIFHAALSAGGTLFLGRNEASGSMPAHFELIHERWKLFRRRSMSESPIPAAESDFTAPAADITSQVNDHSALAALVHQQFVREMQTGIAVVDQFDHTVYLQGQVDWYLHVATGEQNGHPVHIADQAREGLGNHLRSLLQTVRSGQPTAGIECRVRCDAWHHRVRITARPLQGLDHAILLTFTDPDSSAETGTGTVSSVVEALSNQDLPENETSLTDISALQDHNREPDPGLAKVGQPLAVSNNNSESEHQPHPAAGDVSLPVSDDFRVGNETAASTQKEPQSLNEELLIRNRHLERKLNHLQETSDELQNLLLSTQLPTIYIDTRFCIRRFTPSATAIFHIADTDTGRPLSDVRAEFHTDEVFHLARRVLDRIQAQECSVETADGKSYLARLQPYRVKDNHIRGVVMTFSDITDLRASEQLAQARLAELKTIYDSTPIGLSFMDKNCHYRNINSRLAAVNGVPVEATIGRSLREILPDPLGNDVERLYRKVIETGQPIDNFEVIGQTAGSDGPRNFRVSYHPVSTDDGDIFGVSAVVEDVTDRKRLELDLRTSEEQLKQIADNSDYIFWITDLNRKQVLYVSPAFERVWGHSPDALFQDASLWSNSIHADDVECVREAYKQWIRTSGDADFDIEYRIIRGGTQDTRWIHDRGSIVREEDGTARRVAGIARDITESKRWAEQLEHTQAQLQAFLDNAPVMMGLVEIPADDSDILHMLDSRATEKFRRHSIGETAGKWGMQDLGVTQEQHDLWIRRFRESQQKGRPVRFQHDYEQVSEDGSEGRNLRRLNTTVSCVGPGDNQRERFCYVSVDDTDRLRIADDLKQSQKTFATIVQDCPFGLYVIDSSFRICEVSRGAQKTFETVQPIIGRDLAEVMQILWPARFAAEAIARFRHTLDTGEPFETAETTEHRGDIDAVESYHWQLQRIVLPDGQYGVVCYFYDLTPLKRAELALRQSEGRLRLAAELASVGVIRFDYRRNEGVLDDTTAELFGLPAGRPVSREEIHGRIHPKDRERVLEKIRLACRGIGSSVVSTNHRIVQPDGTVKWVNVCKRFYFDSSSDSSPPSASHSIEAVVDVTDRKEYEARLQAARRQAEAANQARGEFLANMSHEIRTPMTAILGYADMLSEHLKDPDNKQCVETIRRNGRFLLDIINDILDLSKIDAGKMVLDTERVPPQMVLADVVSLMNVRAAEKKIELSARFAGAVPATIETDGKRLRQILVNLTGNAIKFTSAGRVSIQAQFNSGTGQLEFAVADTGIGIDAKDLDSLFQPFTQIDASTTRSFGGTGLGLAISRRLAQMLGGDIRAESRPGHGSTFTVAIDPGPVDGVQFTVPSLIGSAPPTLATDITLNCRVLIVDDRHDIRFLAQAFIEMAGGTVITASNGAEGVEKVVEYQTADDVLSVVLMDMQMPVMDGYAAVREIRSRGIDIPIIALTANAMSEDRERCIAAGCTDFLTKPLDKKTLMEMIAKYCRP